MSAYLPNPEHIAALAAYAAQSREQLIISQWPQTAQICAEELAKAAIASVSVRYPDDVSGNRPGPGLTNFDYVVTCGRIARHYLASRTFKSSALRILKMVSGCDYQLCEVDDYEKTPAAQQLAALREYAIRKLPGYDAEPWSFNDESTYKFWPVIATESA